MLTVTFSAEALLALANYLNRKNDLNLAGPASPLVQACKAIDKAAMDHLNGEREERREEKRQHPLYLVIGDVADSRRFTQHNGLDRNRVFASSQPDIMRGRSGPVVMVEWRENYLCRQVDRDNMAGVHICNVTSTPDELAEAREWALLGGRVLEAGEWAIL